MSYANLVMLGASLPSYTNRGKKEAADRKDIIDASDPDNRERVREYLDSIG